jgi:hypothetical protein
LGTIAPVNPAAQLINFQVNLPTTWNGKALQYGGGGFNGTPRSASSRITLSRTSPFTGCRLMTSNTTHLGASTPLPERQKSLRIPIERTSYSRLRLLPAAAHVKR